MDLADIKRQANAAREFVVEVGAANAPRHLTLRAPTAFEVKVAALRSGVAGIQNDQAAIVVLQRALLVAAVVGWVGVCVGDVLKGHANATDALDWDASAVELLLDAQPEWAEALGSALLDRMAQRREDRDTAEKN